MAWVRNPVHVPQRFVWTFLTEIPNFSPVQADGGHLYARGQKGIRCMVPSALVSGQVALRIWQTWEIPRFPSYGERVDKSLTTSSGKVPGNDERDVHTS